MTFTPSGLNNEVFLCQGTTDEYYSAWALQRKITLPGHYRGRLLCQGFTDEDYSARALQISITLPGFNK